MNLAYQLLEQSYAGEHKYPNDNGLQAQTALKNEQKKRINPLDLLEESYRENPKPMFQVEPEKTMPAKAPTQYKPTLKEAKFAVKKAQTSPLKEQMEYWEEKGGSFWKKEQTAEKPLFYLSKKLPEPNKISEKDLKAIPFISVLPTKARRAAYGAVRGVIKTAESFTSPTNIALMAGSMGAGALVKGLETAISALFAYNVGKGLVKSAKPMLNKFEEEVKKGDYGNAAQTATEFLSTLAVEAGLIKGTAKGAAGHVAERIPKLEPEQIKGVQKPALSEPVKQAIEAEETKVVKEKAAKVLPKAAKLMRGEIEPEMTASFQKYIVGGKYLPAKIDKTTTKNLSAEQRQDLVNILSGKKPKGWAFEVSEDGTIKPIPKEMLKPEAKALPEPNYKNYLPAKVKKKSISDLTKEQARDFVQIMKGEKPKKWAFVGDKEGNLKPVPKEMLWKVTESPKTTVTQPPRAAGEEIPAKTGKVSAKAEKPAETPKTAQEAKAEAKASTKKQPIVMTEEDYLASKGAGKLDYGESALHKNIPYGKQREKLLDIQLKKDKVLAKKREELKKEYKEKLKTGEIREPTRIEHLMRTAQGHPDNQATKAARNLLRKKGIDWETGKKIVVKKYVERKGRDLWSRIIKAGGLNKEGMEASGFSLKNAEHRRNYFGLIRKGGLSPDEMAENLIKNGVIPPKPRNMNASDYLMSLLDKEKNGEPVTIDAITEKAERQYAEERKGTFETEEVNEAELEQGDEFTIYGEKYRVVKKEPGKTIIQDGQRQELEDFEKIDIDKGSLKKGHKPKPKKNYVVEKTEAGEQIVPKALKVQAQFPSKKIKAPNEAPIEGYEGIGMFKKERPKVKQESLFGKEAGLPRAETVKGASPKEEAPRVVSKEKEVKATDAVKEYEKQIKRIARGIKRGFKKSKVYLDDLEKSKRAIESAYHDKIAELELPYKEEVKLQNKITDALEDVDKKYFGYKNRNGVFAGYDFVKGTKKWQKLISKETTKKPVTKEGKLSPKLSKLADKLDAKAKEHWDKSSNQLNTGFDPHQLAALVYKTAAEIVRLGEHSIRFSEWARRMIKEHGEDIKPYLKSIWKESRRLAQKNVEIARKSRKAPVVFGKPDVITIEEKEALKESLKQQNRGARYFRSMVITKRKNLEALRKELRQYLMENFSVKAAKEAGIPDEVAKKVRYRLNYEILKVKKPEDIVKIVDAVEKFKDKLHAKKLTEDIKKELKVTVPKAEHGILKGKYKAHVQDRLDFIRQNMAKPHAVNYDRLEHLIQMKEDAIQKGLDADEIERIDFEIFKESYNGLKGMTPQELENTLATIKELKQDKRYGEKKRAEHQRLVEQFKMAISGGKGEKIEGSRSVPTKKESKLRELMTSISNVNLGWSELMEKISSRDKTSKPHEGLINEVADYPVHEARAKQLMGEQKYQKMVQDAIKKIFGVKTKAELSRVVRAMGNIEHDLGTFKNMEGKKVHLRLTKDQMIEKYMQMLDPTLEKEFGLVKNKDGKIIRGLGWTKEMREAVVNALTDKEIEYAHWIMDFYQKYWPELNEVYRKKYGVNLPHNPYYSPIARDVDSIIPEPVLMGREAMRYGTANTPNIKTRVPNRYELKFNGATQTLMQYIVRNEHFKAFAEPVDIIRRIFMDKEVTRLIRQYYGANTVKTIHMMLDRIARDGGERAGLLGAMANYMRRAFTRSVLGIKPVVAIKQQVSNLAYMTEVPFTDFWRGYVDFFEHPIKNAKFLRDHSPILKARWGAGFERDINYVLKYGKNKGIVNGRNFLDYFLLPIRWNDTFATAVGSWIKFKSELARNGGDVEKAIRAAEMTTERTQPTSNIETLSLWQSGNAWYKLMSMFMNQPNKYYRIIAENIRNFKTGRGSRLKAAGNIVWVWYVLPAIFQFIGDAFQKKEKHLLRPLILGPVNDLILIGTAAQALYNHVTGENWDYSVTPVASTINDLAIAASKASKLGKKAIDPLEYVTEDDIINAAEYIAKAVGEVTGAPTPYLVQSEKAIRKKKPLGLIFSEYALKSEKTGKTKEQKLRKARTIYKRLYVEGGVDKAEKYWKGVKKVYPDAKAPSGSELLKYQRRAMRK